MLDAIKPLLFWRNSKSPQKLKKIELSLHNLMPSGYVASIYYYFLGISEIHDSLVKYSTVPFWATFGKTWDTFYFSIWSHCNRKAHSHEEDLHCIGVFCYDQNDAECFSDRMLCRAGVWHS